MTANVPYRWIGAFLLLGVLAPTGSAQAEPASHSGQQLIFNSERLPGTIGATAFAPAESSTHAMASKRHAHGEKTADAAESKTEKAVVKPAAPRAVHRIKPVHPAVVKEQSVPLGRIPFESGTFGFDTSTKLKSREFPDGEQLPSYHALRREGGIPFIGLSLSVPTSSLPSLSLPRPNAD